MASLSQDTNEFSLEKIVHNTMHLYTSARGLQHEEDNPSDSKAVAVTRNNAVIGHYNYCWTVLDWSEYTCAHTIHYKD